jgi:acetyl esterase/lipase
MKRWPTRLLGLMVATLVSDIRAEVRRDIEYGTAGGEHLLLDANIPDGDGPFPIAILVHGGGWSSGDKAGPTKPNDSADITPWFAPLSAAKFVWFSINYRLAPQHKWPAGFEDVETAIRWIKAHAAEFKGNPKRVALFGHSSAGHYVTYIATSGAAGAEVSAVVGFAPVTDLESDSERRGEVSSSLQNLLGLPPPITAEARNVLRDLSPLQHVHAGMPPVLLIQGDADKTVPLAHTQAFYAKLRAAGVPCDLIALPGAGHRLTEWTKADPEWMEKVIAWLNRVMPAGPRLLEPDQGREQGRPHEKP